MFLVGLFLCDDLDGIVNELQVFQLEKCLYGACLVGPDGIEDVIVMQWLGKRRT
jgi:hypothetical protein